MRRKPGPDLLRLTSYRAGPRKDRIRQRLERRHRGDNQRKRRLDPPHRHRGGQPAEYPVDLGTSTSTVPIRTSKTLPGAPTRTSKLLFEAMTLFLRTWIAVRPDMRVCHGCRRTFRSSEPRTAGTPLSAPTLSRLAERRIHIHLPPTRAGSIRVLGCCRRSSSRLFPSIAGLTPLEGLNQFNEYGCAAEPLTDE